MEKFKYLRVDDFPHGDKHLFSTQPKEYWRKHLENTLRVLNDSKVPYILGVSPDLCDSSDVNFLNDNLGDNGEAVLHGFTHAWDHPDWSRIVTTWERGGEFANKNKSEIQAAYNRTQDFIAKVNRWNRKHLIPPFNAFNETVVEFCAENSITEIHTCSKEYIDFGQEKYFKGYEDKCRPIISEWQTTYCDSNVVLYHWHKFNSENRPQITLHWIYDMRRLSYLTEYAVIGKMTVDENSKLV